MMLFTVSSERTPYLSFKLDVAVKRPKKHKEKNNGLFVVSVVLRGVFLCASWFQVHIECTSVPLYICNL